MRATWTMFLKDLRRRVRDRTAFIYGFVAPFVIALVLGIVFGDVGDPVTLDVAVAADPSSSLSRPLLDATLPALVEDGLVGEVTVADSRADAVAVVESGEADVGFAVLPDGASGPGGIEVLERAEQGIAGSIATSIARGLVDEARVATAASAAAAATGSGVPPADAAAAAASTPSVASVELVGVGTAPLDARTNVAVGIAAFFLLFAVGIATTGLVEEEQTGTLARLRAAPVPQWSVIASKGLLAMAIGVFSLTTLAIATTVALDADWGDPLLLAPVFVAGVAAAAGYVGLAASFGRTPEAASNATAVVATVSGSLGGAFFPISEGPVLQALSALTPHRWFLEGVRGASGGAEAAQLLGDVAILLLIAAVTGGLAVFRFSRRVGGA